MVKKTKKNNNKKTNKIHSSKINNLNKSIRNKKKSKKSKKEKKMSFMNMFKGGNPKTCLCIDYEKKDSVYTNYFNGTKCTRPSVNGTDFCEKHQDCMGFVKSFMNGSEIPYEPTKWNGTPEILNSHNCYTYFLNNQIKPVAQKCQEYTKHNQQSKCGRLKPQPGDFSELVKNGTLKMKDREYTCPSMTKKVISDNPSIRSARFDEKCPRNSYKGALVVDPNNTFHFYRQNADGKWSHKPGVLEVIDKDASNDPIYFPHLADRNYNKDNNDGINYTDFCEYLCVPNDKSNVKIFSI
jgi:hypothetical protein